MTRLGSSKGVTATPRGGNPPRNLLPQTSPRGPTENGPEEVFLVDRDPQRTLTTEHTNKEEN